MRGFSAILSDNNIYNEWDIATPTKPGWLVLKDIIKEKNLKLIDLVLCYDHQRIYVAKHGAVYFYKKRASAWLDCELPPTQEYGIGASDTAVMLVTWYDGNNSKEELRHIITDDAGFIINEQPKESKI